MNPLFKSILIVLILTGSGISIAADESETTVVFLRSSMVGSAIKATVYEVTDGETKFLGILKNNRRIDFKTTPGKHTFMVVSEAADFMEANLLEGKTYYSIVIPRMGGWKARFSMYPVRNDGTTKFNTDRKNFSKWLKKTKPSMIDAKALAWYEKRKKGIEAKRTKHWMTWRQKSDTDLGKRTLRLEDGT